MAEILNRQIVLAARPNGRAKLTDFAITRQPRPTPSKGEVLFHNTLISIDPYQRNLMGNASSELPPIELGQTMPGPTVAVVEESSNPAFAVGDEVLTWSGWQEYGVSDGAGLRKLARDGVPVSTALGALGHTGLTAWVGMTKFATPKPGGTVVVTAAAGAVGSLAAQIARLRGHRVVGIAGGPGKIRFLKHDLGLDEAVDYKADGFVDQLARALPDGIDTLFDNVGGALFEALMPFLNHRAQVVICGSIAQYDHPGPGQGPDYLPEFLKLVLYRFVEIRGFALPDHFDSFPAFLAEVRPWVTEGRIKFAEHVVDGFDAIPAAFLGLFEGRNRGKLMARVG